MFLRFCLRNCFAKIKKEEVVNSTYSELAAMVANKYSNQEYKNANTICLHEIQQQHKVIMPGDWVLDIGAGPNFYWTDLALKLADNQKQMHRVISNDKVESTMKRSNHVYVKGDFLEEQVRTNIGLQLGDHKINTILVDASPQYTGKLENDGAELNQVVFQAMYFSNIFLEKGGNFVCKVLNCESSKLLEETARIFFHQFFIFKPSVIRLNSPVQFFVMKGFAMNYELEAMKEFIARYRGSAKTKTEVVRQYQGKYKWDAIQVIRNKIKNDALGLILQGRSLKDIEKVFAHDPFVKIGEIIKQIKAIEQAKENKDQLAMKKAMNKFTEGKLYKQSMEVPSTREQWINYLQKMENQMKNLRKKEKPQKAVQNLQPLRDNEVYMKSNDKVEDEPPVFLYLQADLLGNYHISYETQHLQQQLAKIQSTDPQFQKRIQKVRKGIKEKASLDEIFNSNTMEKEQLQAEEGLHDLAQAFQAISDQDFKKIMDKEGYEDELRNNIKQRDRSSKQKYRNR